MFANIISFSVRNKFIVGIGVLGLIIAGIWSLRQIPIDAVPDITNNQVQVVTTSPTLAPQEVEQLITYPIEVSMANIPGVIEIRSISRFGLSVVTVVFEENIPILDARQYVKEQLSLASGDIPSSLGQPELMPITTGLGEIYQYVLQVEPGYEKEYDAMKLRTIQDWIVKRQLNGITGIVEVSSFGGYLKQYEVAVQPDLMKALDISLEQVHQALATNNENSGGSYIEEGTNAFYIRTEGRVNDLEDIATIVVANRDGVPVLIRDVAKVRLGHAVRFGAMTMDGEGEAVGGITLMLKGANSSEAIQNVHDRIEQVKQSLPEGVTIYPYLDRSELVNRTISTASNNLIEGGLIVIFVLVLLLGNWRAGLIVASVIPLAMLFALTMMNLFGVSANLMSLGAIDFGIVVDGAVIIVEAVLHIIYTHYVGRKLSQQEMDGIIIKSSSSIYRSAAFGVLIILVVFIPIMTLTGIEGKMFRPMAMTVSFAILGALILSLTYVPMISALALKKNIKDTTSIADRIVGAMRKAYRPTLVRALKVPWLVISIAFALLVASIFAFRTMGAEFIPTLEEGDLAMQMTIQPGSSLDESIATTTKAEKVILQHFPEVEHVVSKIGTAEVPTDPMAVEDADIMLVMKPKSEWTTTKDREELVAMMKEKLTIIAGASFEFTQPIQLRFNELMTGAKADVAIKIYGEDLATLAQLGDDAAAVINRLPGAGDVKVEQTEGFPQLKIDFHRDKVAQYGLDISQLNLLVRAAYAGEKAGVVFQGERKFDLVVRFAPSFRASVNLDNIYIPVPSGGHIPLSEVASVDYAEGPMQISREDTKRRITIGVNVRDRDVASLVEDIQRQLDSNLDLPPGYYIQYGGQFENLEAARDRLAIAVPAALLMILLLLYFAFTSFKYALLIFSAVPLSAIGGVAALLLRGMPFSISAGVGFIALFGVAVLNGIVLISYFNQLRAEGMTNLHDIVIQGGLVRLRPVVMTAAVASLGFLPMALSNSAGAEVQKPLATVVIGGLITATFLTLVVLPVLYYLLNRKAMAKGLSTLLVLLAIGAGSPALHAQDTTVLTLEAAWQHAQANRPDLQIAQLQVDEAATLQKQAIQLAPTQASFSYGQLDGPDIDWQWSITQNFGNIAAHIKRSQLAQRHVQSAVAQQALKQWQAQLEVESTWYQWQYAWSRWRAFAAQQNRYASYAEKATLQWQTGAISPLQAELAKTQALTVQQEATAAQLNYQDATTQLQQLTFMGEAIRPPTDTLPQRKLPGGSATINLEPLLSPTEAATAVAEQQVSLAKSQYFPQLSGGYFRQQLGGVAGFQGVTAGLAIPLWWGPNQGQLQQARLQQEQKLLQWEQQAFMLEQEAQRWLQQWQRLAAQLPTAQQYQAQSQQLRKAATLAWEAGEIDYFRLVQLLDQAFQLQLQHLDLVHQYNQATIQFNYFTK